MVVILYLKYHIITFNYLKMYFCIKRSGDTHYRHILHSSVHNMFSQYLETEKNIL